MRSRLRGTSGFTLVEIMVVTFVSVLLMTVGATIYSTCLRAYREAQGRTNVFQTAKFINRDLREALAHVVPVKGSWVARKGKLMPGISDSGDSSIDRYYRYNRGSTSKWTAMNRNKDYDYLFTGPQYPAMSTTLVGDKDNAYKVVRGYARRDDWYVHDSPENWPYGTRDYHGHKGWWMPAFFGRRHDSGNLNDTILEADNIIAGSWGWPKPDYRLDASADKIDDGSATLTDGGNICAWWYAESRYFKSPYTLALDNANVHLVSLKFSMKPDTGGDDAKLSILRHQIVGFDTAAQGHVKGDLSFGDMLRHIKIEAYYLNSSGDLVLMDDNAYGVDMEGNWTGDGTGLEIPRCFDVKFVLRNPGNLKKHRFGMRVFHLNNPQ